MKTIKLLKYLLIGIGVILIVAFGAFIFLLKPIPFGFGPGIQDFTYGLSGDYELVRSSAHTIMVVPVDGWNNEIPIIPEKVLEIAWNKQFILAKRQGLKRRSPDNPNDTYMEPDDSVFDYWILDTTIPQVYGPLTLEEFKNKRTELSVPDELILQDLYQYK